MVLMSCAVMEALVGFQNAGKAIVMLLIQGIVPHQYQQGLGMWKQTVSKERKIPLFL